LNEAEKRDYLERYRQAKQTGVPFFPDILFKDALVSLLVFLVLVGLAFFLGAPLEGRADPADTSYTPRPEWYFLFLFQMLKYFPGKLEVIGAVVIPTLAILLLLLLPLLDRSPKRSFANRPFVTAATSFFLVGVITLTILAYLESPPPAEATRGDQTAALYTKNCASCHGTSIEVKPGTNLHTVIAQGKHEGMPAWSADLTSDQIDALAGFILSPAGSDLFTNQCSACHEVTELVSGSPIELKNALEQGANYPAHTGQDIPQWSQVLSQEERATLLNFLAAPDGQRLFATNCSPCHGHSVAYSGEEAELRAIISQGGLHLEMPPWRETLSDPQLETLARFVVDPASTPEGQSLFAQFCVSCHGDRIPSSQDLEAARLTIASGGPHQTMPVWGEVLTPEQLDALVAYTLNAAKGTSLEIGQQLFTQNCAQCHGDFGEGGPNPTRPNDIIAPISSAEYLKTRDNLTLRAIISQGQPNFGMSPFGSSSGGPLDDDEVDAIVAYMRSWQDNPPVEFPPEVIPTQIGLTGPEIYADLCAQCHGTAGEGGIGLALNTPDFQSGNSDEQIFATINLGHPATAMIGWGEILTAEQIQQLVDFIRAMRPSEAAPSPTQTPGSSAITFVADISPIFQAHCNMCHGTLGGWDGTSYQAAMTSGNHAPVVIPGDVENSLLAQKLLGTQSEGTLMPPSGKLPEDQLQLILDWIAAGAPER